MDHKVIAVQKLTIEIINKIDETKINSYPVIVGALLQALMTTFHAIKEEHSKQVADQFKVGVLTCLSMDMQEEETPASTQKDLN